MNVLAEYFKHGICEQKALVEQVILQVSNVLETTYAVQSFGVALMHPCHLRHSNCPLSARVLQNKKNSLQV